MPEIRSYAFVRHLRGESSAHVLAFKKGRVVASGRGIDFWFLPMSTSIAEIPVDDRELSFLFHGRSSDFQDVTAQGVVMYRVVDPQTLSERVDFNVDVRTGRYLQQPLQKLSLVLTSLAQQLARDYMISTPVRELLRDGAEQIRDRIHIGLREDEGINAMGLEIISVRVAALSPTPELEAALELPTREKIQQAADEASFQRRALAVEKERAIAENELQNQIELAKREETLIERRGKNERRRVEEAAESKRIESEAKAERSRIEAIARAESIRAVETARVEGERERMAIYKELPPSVTMGLAARELAGKLERIEHLNIAPEMLGPLLSNLVRAGTARLEGDE